MEDGVYVCSWSRSSEGITLWLTLRPIIRASAPTYAEAEARFIEAIHNAGGAIHAVLEFDPPLPKSPLEEKYSSTEVYLICGDDRFETDAPRKRGCETAAETDERLRWVDSFYEKPVCRWCRATSGRRNDKPVTLSYTGKYDGAFGSLGKHGGPHHQIVSEAFLALLTEGEKSRLQFQPPLRKGRKRFFELVGPEGSPYVAVAGMKINGWRCSRCDHATWGYWIEGMELHSFIAQSDLPDPAHGVLTIGTFPEVELAVTGLRWGEMVGRTGTRGFASRPLGVVSDANAVRHPELPLLKGPFL